MFTLNHFIWLFICSVFVFSLTFISIKFKWKLKKAINVMCLISIISELVKIFSNIRMVNGVDYSDGGYIRASALPFHLCSILIFIFFYMAFSKNEKNIKYCLNFFLPIGYIASILALFMATSGVSFTSFSSIQSFFYHSGILWFALYLTISKQVDLTIKDFFRNIITLLVLSIIVIWINGALRTAGCDTVNFFFLVKPPMEGLPLLNLKHGWHAYFAHLAFLGIFLEFIVTLPFLLKKGVK